MQVSSGDVVIADRDGVVVIPQTRLVDVVARVEAIVLAEAETIAQVSGGRTTFSFMDDLLRSDHVRYEE